MKLKWKPVGDTEDMDSAHRVETPEGVVMFAGRMAGCRNYMFYYYQPNQHGQPELRERGRGYNSLARAKDVARACYRRFLDELEMARLKQRRGRRR